MIPSLLLLLGLGSVPQGEVPAQPTPREESAPAWVETYARGVELAKKSERDLLVDFTGSDWCSWCKKLDAEVFKHSEFLEGTSKDYVLVKIDLPRNSNALALVPDIKANRELAYEFGIRKYPTVLLMTANGDVFGTTGYVRGGARNYLQHLEELRSKGRPPITLATALAAEFEAAEESEREAVALRALDALRSMDKESAGVRYLIPVVGYLIDFDPTNSKGHYEPALRALLPSGHATAEQIASGIEFDPQNELGVQELAVLAKILAAKSDWELRHATKAINALDDLGPLVDPDVAGLIYLRGAIWNERYLRDSARATAFVAKARPLLGNRPKLNAQLQAFLRRR